jgi:NAD-dependent dihydropyrimidine dehydrogenase PreA subunit
VPWYPVIDAARCVRCGQCVKFCLFGVYATAPDGLPIVARPEKCKNRCPACARICPAAAIIFPRYEESPFNGDDVKDDDDARLAAHREDVKRILGDDPIAALRARQERARARRLVDPAKLDAALAERERHLRAESPEGKA